MIKLKICTSSTTKKNVLVDFDQHQQQTIGQFIERAVDICGVLGNPVEYELYYEQYNLPNKLSSGHLNPEKTYSLIRKRSKKEKIEQKKKDKSGRDVRIQIEKKPISEESDSSSESSGLQQIGNREKKSKIEQQKIQEAVQKRNQTELGNEHKQGKGKGFGVSGRSNKEPTEKDSVTKSKPISGGEGEKSSIGRSIGFNIRPEAKRLQQQGLFFFKENSQKKQNKLIRPSEEQSESSQESPAPVKKVIKKKIAKPVVSDSSSLQSSEEKRQHQTYHKKINEVLQKVTQLTGNQNRKPVNEEKQIQKNKSANNPPTNNRPNNQPNNQVRLAVPLSVRKKNIDTSLRQKKEQKIQNPSQQRQKDKIPQSFKEYQELKWVPITKEYIGKWNEQHTNKPYLFVGNEIRFKIVDIDLQKFVPVTSGWITGFITKLDAKGQETNISFDEVVKSDRQNQRTTQKIPNYSLATFNMQQIQINRHTLTADQHLLRNERSQKIIESKIEVKQDPIAKAEQVPEEAEGKQEKPTKSLQDFIRGQINYYFSDKNYLTDLYLRMQANTHPEKYIKVEHFQNFPKIKKVLKDKSKLWEYLASDQKISQRNYELEFENKMIRKKN